MTTDLHFVALAESGPVTAHGRTWWNGYWPLVVAGVLITLGSIGIGLSAGKVFTPHECPPCEHGEAE